MMATTKVMWACYNCDREIEVTVGPFVRVKFRGHPDSWQPAEGGEIEPTECECGAEIDADRVHEMAGQEGE